MVRLRPEEATLRFRTTLDAQQLVESWKQQGRARLDGTRIRFAPRSDEPPAEVLRRAYRWIVERGIVCEAPDLQLGAPRVLGRQRVALVGTEEAYASYVLLPLLNLVTHQRMLIIGAPGRGKTTLATLMALVAGGTLKDVRRDTQHGHPQLTIADLLGSPLPGNLVEAKTPDEVVVAWRMWIERRVKIVDEYNRIPTKTQSALLSLMAEGYAEQFGQVVHSGRSAWFLTANDDLGGGTFQVIDALKDRIDAVVRAVPFEGNRLRLIAERIASAERPEDVLPDDLRLTPESLDRADAEIRAVAIPDDVLDALGSFAAQIEFCQMASKRLEHMTKDTLRVAGRRLAQVCNEDCPLDKREHVCAQSEAGISTRAHAALLRYSQALAWFRGRTAVSFQDIRALLPWVLHERLNPNTHSGFFLDEGNQVYLSDRTSWIVQLFDRAVSLRDAHAGNREPLEALSERVPTSREDARALLREIEAAIENLLDHHELNGLIHEDLLRLKALHHRWRPLATGMV